MILYSEKGGLVFTFWLQSTQKEWIATE